MRTVASSEVKTRLQSDSEHAILDVRREGEFAQGHLFFATNVPRALLELKIERLVPRKNTPIAIVAANEDEASSALAALEAMGYSEIAVLENGVQGWVAAGGALFGGLNVPSKAFGEFVEVKASTPHIAPEALHDLIERNANLIVFDSRPYAEYRNMNIPGSIKCPGAELVSRIGAYLPDKDSLVVVNCAGRTRSIMGAQSLIDAGIQNKVVALRDGTMGWRLAGFPLESGQTRRAKRPSDDAVERARAKASRVGTRAGVNFLASEDIDAALKGSDSKTLYLFDVRDPEEYAEGHREGVMSAPGAQLVQTFDTLVAVHNASIIVTDSDGTRAPVTAAWLKQMGIKNVSCAIDARKESTKPPPTPPGLGAILRRAKEINVAEAANRIAAGNALLLDLANSKEYKAGHIPSALFCERHQLPDFLREAEDKEIILTSPDGRLAGVASSDFQSPARAIAALKGGTRAWKDAGRAVENGRGNLPENPGDVYYRPYDLSAKQEEAMQAYLDWEKDLMVKAMNEPGIAFWRAQAKSQD